MRILFVSAEFPPETGWGGIGTYVAAMTRALVAAGQEIHVLSCVAGQAPSDPVRDGIHVHRRGLIGSRFLLPYSSPLRISQTVQRVLSALSVYREVRRLRVRFDIIEYPDWGAEGWLLPADGGSALVAHLHTALPVIRRYNREPSTLDSLLAARIESRAVAKAHAVTAPSALVVSELTAAAFLSRRDVAVVPYPLPRLPADVAVPVEETPPAIVFVGRLEARKAPETLVQALTLLEPSVPAARAVFAGRSGGFRDGRPYLEWVQSQASPQCLFVGAVSRDEVARLIGTSRVLVLPSRFDNYPNAVLEAMAAARPVVVSAATGTAPLVLESGGGAVVPPGDAPALARALKPLLTDPAYAACLGRRGQQAVLESLAPALIAQRRLDIYARAVRAAEGGHAAAPAVGAP